MAHPPAPWAIEPLRHWTHRLLAAMIQLLTSVFVQPVMEDPKAQQTPLKKNRRSRADSIREALPPGPLSSIAKRAARQALSFVHILTWIPNYSKDDIVCDIIAGITIGLTMLPQSLAYALLAGLSPQYGLYSSFVGTLIYIVFGTVKEVSIGPTSLMALLTYEYTRDHPVEFVILLTFLTGCMELLFGILHLGVLVDFISAPVLSGFTAATSVVIGEAQMKGLLGIKYKSVGFIDNVWKLFSHMKETKPGDAILGVSSMIFLLSFRKLKDIPVGKLFSDGKLPNESNPKARVVEKILWFLTIGRNALIVLIGGILSFVFERNWGVAPFALSGQIDPGFPSFQPPPFQATYANTTYNFGEMASELGTGILIVPVVSVLVNIAIAKAYANGGTLHATQEMLTLGLCNIAGSFVSSMPTCGAFTRSAVSSASGVRTLLAGLYTGTLIMLALGFLTPYFYYIPRATLSAVLICAVMFMADFGIYKKLWQTSKQDFLAAILTFVVCLLLGIEIGLLLGVALNCGHLLYLWARPRINVEHKKMPGGRDYLMVTLDTGLYFPAIEFIRMELGRIGVSEGDGVQPLVLNCEHFKGLDYSAAMGFVSVMKEYKKRAQPIVLMNLKDDALSLLQKLCVYDAIHCTSEGELAAILYGEITDSEDTVLLNGVITAPSDGMDTPSPERHLSLDVGDGGSDPKALQ
ncbi:sodium-independent sulfate anion transporter-like isoform X1 [Ischnura elegans]|uniref:sodium-independent sulfate anion transporter-like isoform X1 n=2 Tax=Ischnura elegans TaxID=197161 RepID=UPI001ED8A973|nr:sodium-independent sulfate anion transporter-like isoform X1 [Ischnura elegans]